MRRDAGRDAAARFNRDGERGAERRRVVLHHIWNLQFVEPRTRQGHADQTAGFLAHEVDRGRRDFLGRHDDVAFVLAVLVIENDDHLAVANVRDRRFYGIHGAPWLRQPDCQLRQRRRERPDRFERRLAPAGPEVRNRPLGQAGTLGEFDRR